MNSDADDICNEISGVGHVTSAVMNYGSQHFWVPVRSGDTDTSLEQDSDTETFHSLDRQNMLSP